MYLALTAHGGILLVRSVMERPTILQGVIERARISRIFMISVVGQVRIAYSVEIVICQLPLLRQ